jgi:hypothetical protein
MTDCQANPKPCIPKPLPPHLEEGHRARHEAEGAAGERGLDGRVPQQGPQPRDAHQVGDALQDKASTHCDADGGKTQATRLTLACTGTTEMALALYGAGSI